MIKTITANELYSILKEEIEKGNGEMPIIIAGTEWDFGIAGEFELIKNSPEAYFSYDPQYPKKYLLLR